MRTCHTRSSSQCARRNPTKILGICTFHAELEFNPAKLAKLRADHDFQCFSSPLGYGAPESGPNVRPQSGASVEFRRNSGAGFPTWCRMADSGACPVCPLQRHLVRRLTLAYHVEKSAVEADGEAQGSRPLRPRLNSLSLARLGSGGKKEVLS